MARTPHTAFVALLVAALVAISSPLAAQYYEGFGKNKVQYRDFEWKIYHSPHFDVYYYEQEAHLLQKVVSFAESAYDQLSREFDLQIQEPTPLIFYATHSAFEQNNIILNFIPEGVGAFASPARNRMVLPVDMPDPELMDLILHELTHIFQYHILFQGSLGKSAALRPPQWFMEGMASYMADDEIPWDQMVLRDAVVNDIIPSVSQGNFGGYFAYRLGHAVFDYIEERWGREGFLDFVYEMRNTIGGRTGRALEQAFRIDPEDFDLEFRRWLRKKYLRQLVETGEPSDFGRPLRVEDNPNSIEISPAASPSGDLVAAFSVQKGDIDVVLFDANRRRQIRNLTRGLSTEYQYLVVQGLTVARKIGRDLAFSADGNYLAAFARRDRGRDLLLFDVLNGGIARKIAVDVEQQVGVDWSPDSRTVVFSGNRDGQFDIYLLDVETEEVRKLTDDPVFDGGAVFSPDGKSVLFTSVVGDYKKLFRVELDDPSRRYQVTTGESNDVDAVFSTDGTRIYFSSDRNGFDNIYGLDLATGELRQYTDVVTGCFMPTVLANPEGGDSLVYGGLWKGSYKLYLTDLEEPIGEPEMVDVPEQPTAAADLEVFEPPIEVSIDEGNQDEYGGFNFFLADAGTNIAVDDDQTFLGQIYLSFSDYLGDKRIFALLSSYDALSNFDITYADLSDRLQWSVNLFDSRDFFFVVRDQATGRVLDRQQEVRITGVIGSITYPFSFYTRFEAGAGYVFQKIEYPVTRFDSETGNFVIGFEEFKDDFPWFQTALVGDSTIFDQSGPVSGRRWRVAANYAPQVSGSGGGTRTAQVTADFRQYVPFTRRTGLAVRGFAGAAFGDVPNFFYIGGRELRGFRFRSLTGDRVGFINTEIRFPIVDVLATPVLRFQGIRGRIFLDVGAVYFDQILTGNALTGFDRVDNPDSFDFWNSDENRLEDGISVYGWGFTIRFLGLDLNWDFAKRWDFDSTFAGSQSTFYIGTQF